MDKLFLDLTIVFVLATFLAYFFSKLKLPTILGYIFTGLIIGPIYLMLANGIHLLENEEIFESLSKIGITLLLFILGLEMKVSELRSVGKVAIFTGIGQIVFTSLIGLLFALIIGFPAKESVYIAIALTFSSTIVIVKLLSDKNDLNSLYGKISIGFLLIQDFVAILMLVFLNGLSSGDGNSFDPTVLAIIILKTVLVFAVVTILSKTVIPKLLYLVSNSLELLFLFSIAWAFGIAWIIQSEFIGLSIEIGGFLAGIALAGSSQSLQIVSKVRALRDFFIIIFFVHLGLMLDFSNFHEVLLPSLFFALFVLVGNPLIVFLILTAMGYKARTGFLSGLTVAQISEFSLIVISIGVSIGDVSSEIVTIMTIVGIITFAVSSYMIMQGEWLYSVFDPFLRKFEKKNNKESFELGLGKLSNHIVLVGAHRMGEAILENFKNEKDRILIIDFNPEVVKKLKEEGYSAIFGDIIEQDIVEVANLDEAEIIISTVPNLEDNIILVQKIKTVNPSVEVIVSADRPENKELLIEAGADMIIEPYNLAGRMLSNLIKHRELEIK
ncbi:MAG: cation:proton antiporter [Candidatus Dojkabacteria bacterium]